MFTFHIAKLGKSKVIDLLVLGRGFTKCTCLDWSRQWCVWLNKRFMTDLDKNETF